MDDENVLMEINFYDIILIFKNFFFIYYYFIYWKEYNIRLKIN